jgi:transcriptional regulator with XRE-family HTH domain
MKMKKRKVLRESLSANIKNRRKTLDISQERLAELADVSIQTIKGIEGRRTWVSDIMLEKLARALGVQAFQLLAPDDSYSQDDDSVFSDALLRSLHHNLLNDMNARFDRLQNHLKAASK